MHKIRRGTYFQTGFRYCDESFTVSASLYAARANSKPRAKIYLSLKDGDKQLLVDTIDNCTEDRLEAVLTSEIRLMEECEDGEFSDSIFMDAADELMFEDYEDEDDDLDLEDLDWDEPELTTGQEAMNDLRDLLSTHTPEQLMVRINVIPIEEALLTAVDDQEFEDATLPESTRMKIAVKNGMAEVTLTFPGSGELIAQQTYNRLREETVLSYYAMTIEEGEQIVILFRSPKTVKKQRTEDGETAVVLTYQIREDTIGGTHIY